MLNVLQQAAVEVMNWYQCGEQQLDEVIWSRYYTTECVLEPLLTHSPTQTSKTCQTVKASQYRYHITKMTSHPDSVCSVSGALQIIYLLTYLKLHEQIYSTCHSGFIPLKHCFLGLSRTCKDQIPGCFRTQKRIFKTCKLPQWSPKL